MNARFWFTVGVFTGASASALLYFALRSSTPSERGGPAAADVSRPVGTDAAPATQAPSMEAATARLEARLERDGGSAADWELLAKSYEFLARPEAAARARQHTATGEVAQQGGVAESHTEVSSGMPSASVVAKLTSLDDSAPQPRTDLSAAATTAGGISGTVSIEGSLASRVDRNAVLFIYAKAADAPGPPLAVLRLSANSWPVSFRLDDSMAMLPSRRLSQFQKVIVEARISRSGQAAPATGDLYVTSNAVSPSSGKKLALVISHEIG